MKFLQDLTYEDIEKAVCDCDMPKYRAGQLFSWMTALSSFCTPYRTETL